MASGSSFPSSSGPNGERRNTNKRRMRVSQSEPAFFHPKPQFYAKMNGKQHNFYLK